MKKLYDGLHVGGSTCLHDLSQPKLIYGAEFLDLRSHVWGIRKCLVYLSANITLRRTAEQDVHALSKKNSSSVHIV